MASLPPTLPPVLQNIPVTSKLRGMRYLTCQGGGMKGGAFSGCAEILEETGILSQIEEVAGSSAGAIFATLLAVGYSAKEIKEIMEVMDFRRFQDKDAPGWIESTGISDLLSSLSGEEPGKKSKGKLPEGVTVEDVVSLAFSKKLGMWKGDALLTLMERLIARKTGKPHITFKELADMAKLKPGLFRALTLTGSNLSTGKLEHYNAEEWPDMPIVQAVRISASFPGAFMPYTKPLLKRKIGKDGNPEYSEGVRVDGGLLENLPDKFNKPPYFKPERENQANPEVLALSFLEAPKDKEDEINSGWMLLKKMFKALLSEEQVREKYAPTNNIVFIDPVGMNTLDFSADKAKRDKLVRSGWNSVRKTLENFLTKEKQTSLRDMSLQELIRLQTYLVADKSMVEKLVQVKNEIQRRMKEDKNITQNEINKLLLQENDKRDRLIAFRNERENPSDERIIQRLNEKVAELENIKKHELNPQIKELKLVLAGLELEKISFAESLKDKKSKNEFARRLGQIKDITDNIFKAQVELEKVQQKILDELDLEIESKRQVESREARTRKKTLKTLEGMEILKANKLIADHQKGIDELINQKNSHIAGIIKDYKIKKDSFMAHYFQEIRDEFDNPEKELSKPEEQRNVMPGSIEHLQAFIDKETLICEEHLSEARNKLKKTNAEIQNFKQRIQQYEKRSFATDQYETLKTLQTELDRSIYEKTSFLAKINSYFISDKPSRKNFIVTSVMQFIAATAFVLRIAIVIPIAIAATFFIPRFVMKVARLIYDHNKEGPEKMASDRFIHAFSMPNLFKMNKLKYLAKVTADTVTLLDKNYAKADKTEHAYIYRMFQRYLKDSGLKFEEIFPVKEEDTRAGYKQMISKFMKDLAVEDPEYFKILQESGRSKVEKDKLGNEKIARIDINKFPIDRNLEEFYEQVKANLKRPEIALQLEPAKAVRQLELSNRNTQAMQLFIKTINNQINNELPLLDIYWNDENLKRARDTTLRTFRIINPLKEGHPVFTEGMFAEAYVRSIQVLNSLTYKKKLDRGELTNILTEGEMKNLSEEDLITNEVRLKIPSIIKRFYIGRVETIYKQSGLKGLNDRQIKNYINFAADEKYIQKKDNKEILEIYNAIQSRYKALQDVRKISKVKNIEQTQREFVETMDKRLHEYRMGKRNLYDVLSGELNPLIKPILINIKGAIPPESKPKVAETKYEKEMKGVAEQRVKIKIEKDQVPHKEPIVIGKWKLEYLNQEEQLTLEYVKSARELNLNLPKEIHDKFEEILEKADKSDKLEQEMLKIEYNYPVLAEHFEIELPLRLKKKQREAEKEAMKLERDSKSKIEQAMNDFYRQRFVERDSSKKGLAPEMHDAISSLKKKGPEKPTKDKG